jgi:cobalt-zinc-cadmium resistance protein CzcA
VSNYNTLLSTLKKYEAILNNYHQNGKELSQKTVSLANKAFKSGEIDFSKFLQLIEDATLIETEYLSALLNYNKTVLEINYLIN